MIRCPICNKINDDSVKTCTNCGQEIDMDEVKEVLGIAEEKPLDESDKMWKGFAEKFWLLFVIHIALKYSLPFFLPAENPSWPFDFIVFVGIQAIPVILMVVLVAWYSFKFSGKRLHMLYGALGFLWLGTISIFLAYAAVRNQYLLHNGIEIAKWEKVVFWMAVVLLSAIYSVLLLDLISA